MQKKKGISLIVLVITIIVMVILAGTIILTLDNSGIINRAQSAVDEYNEQEVKTLATLKWTEAFMDGLRTQEELEEYVTEELEKENIDLSKYEITVTTQGVSVAEKGAQAAKWVQNGTTVTNGKITLEVGDNIDYDETNGGTITGLTATDWQVLGANENGELLILSTNIVSNIFLDGWRGAGFNQGPTLLNNASEPYGKGNGAVAARSIEVEDVDRITGFDKTTYEGYGDEVTLHWTEEGNATLAINGKTGQLIVNAGNGEELYYYNGNEIVKSLRPETAQSWPVHITTFANDAYDYDLTSLGANSKAYKMLMVPSSNELDITGYDESNGERLL